MTDLIKRLLASLRPYEVGMCLLLLLAGLSCTNSPEEAVIKYFLAIDERAQASGLGTSTDPNRGIDADRTLSDALETGPAIVRGWRAKVATRLTGESGTILSFDTYLERNWYHWKVADEPTRVSLQLATIQMMIANSEELRRGMEIFPGQRERSKESQEFQELSQEAIREAQRVLAEWDLR